MAPTRKPQPQFICVSFPYPHVALLELTRFWEEYSAILDTICDDGDVRVVVLASALPKLFSAGIDVNHLSTLPTATDPARTAYQLRPEILSFQHAISAPERCPVPVIAAVHGVAFGLAIDIIAACDIRYAARDATFSIKEADVGLAADIGTLARTPKITGSSSLLHELAYTARSFNADEALRLGLVSKVVDGDYVQVRKAALEVAKVIASKSPVAVMGTKKLLLHARDHSVRENLEYTAVWNSAMLQTKDLEDALTAFKTKAPPTFAPLSIKSTAKL
ncbi:ClpP/crotonase [Punctularia strigosozonata HHB-11173 SS5]|uniref:ClpP/crotonase n=1 Tax=Punctularia strigosozonata (strain HHB-11173) TaxID=741275 RepID=UPI00044176B7|nr:ClpP/crotonase [Punctularia strigosozonata HHB-11173 SS5]EIN13100.1 ClpP/crotonase [Punctularia strigosozonata HHB-11173 SS5]